MKKILPTKHIAIVTISLGFLATLLYARVQIANNQSTFASPEPAITPTATPVVKGATAKPQPVVNSDPIITCSIHADCGGGSKQMKKSECEQTTCCQIGDKWYLYLSKSQCDKDQSEGLKNNIPTYSEPAYVPPAYVPPTYYKCTLCYSFGCTTYDYLTKTKAECDAKQAIIDALGENNYSTPIPQPTFDVSAYNALVVQCQRDVVYKYRGLLQSCNQYGGSASEACTRIYTDDRQREYDACGQKL